MSIRVGLFAMSFLGFMYGVLSLTNTSKTDVAAGMIIAAVGIVGWGICDYWEERR